MLYTQIIFLRGSRVSSESGLIFPPFFGEKKILFALFKKSVFEQKSVSIVSRSVCVWFPHLPQALSRKKLEFFQCMSDICRVWFVWRAAVRKKLSLERTNSFDLFQMWSLGHSRHRHRDRPALPPSVLVKFLVFSQGYLLVISTHHAANTCASYLFRTNKFSTNNWRLVQPLASSAGADPTRVGEAGSVGGQRNSITASWRALSSNCTWNSGDLA